MSDLLSRIMSRPVVTVTTEANLADAAGKMLDQGIGSVVCVDADGRIVGIVTDSDFGARSAGIPFSTFRAPQLLGKWLGEDAVEKIYQESRRRLVGEVMSSPVHTVDETATVEDVLRIMLQRDVKHVPVVREGRPVGMVARHDLLKFLGERLRDAP